MIDTALFQREVDLLQSQLDDPNLALDKRGILSKKLAGLRECLDLDQKIKDLAKEYSDTEAMCASSADSDMEQLCRLELEDLKKKEESIRAELTDILYPPDPADSKPAFFEIRAGTGGQEAGLFVSDLFKMYSGYADRMGWKVSLDDYSSTDLGGFREIILYVTGKDVYRHLKYESGVHRVQRVPKTESAGRIHTSTVTVAVMPEVDEVAVKINPGDLRIDVYRSSGAGGQHVNTTDSAVRITHIPSGVVVTCQEERSQTKNKVRAMKMLIAKLYAAEQEKIRESRSEQRKSQMGSGDRSEKIRTYNYPQNRITDHRIGLTIKNLEYVMAGDLDEIIQSLISADVKERMAHPSTIFDN